MDWKFEKSSKKFHKKIDNLLNLNISKKDLIHHYPLFSGTVLIARHLTIYEIYKKILNLPGDIAEIGIFKGGSFLFLAKLCEIFEPNSYTRVFGFDWFKGMKPSVEEKNIKGGSYISSYKTLKEIIKIQELDNIAKIVKIDVTKELRIYFEKNKGQKYKLVFFDAGTYEVVKKALPFFWERLVTGGILILDQYADIRAFGETLALDEILKQVELETFSWSRHPTAFIVKK